VIQCFLFVETFLRVEINHFKNKSDVDLVWFIKNIIVKSTSSCAYC